MAFVGRFGARVPTTIATRNVNMMVGRPEDNVVCPPITNTISLDSLLNRSLSTNLIARPLLNLGLTLKKAAILLSSEPGARPFELLESLKSSLDVRYEFNRRRIEKMRQNWGV